MESSERTTAFVCFQSRKATALAARKSNVECTRETFIQKCVDTL